jgi:glutamate 5-kinase
MLRQFPLVENLVIKIGSNILTDGGIGINEERIVAISNVVASIKENIPRVSIVSSGAIAAGFNALGFRKRPKEIVHKQAAAAVGQARLIWFYEQAFSRRGIKTAQILLTKTDFSDRKRYLNARATIACLFNFGVIPIINENDAIVANELKYIETFGDNDNLSALLAGLLNADMLLILSDVDGLYTANPETEPAAMLINDVPNVEEVMEYAAGTSGVGTGGMFSKLNAIKLATGFGVACGIINGKKPEQLAKFIDGEPVGTYFPTAKKHTGAKKRWIANAAIPNGALIINSGALAALYEHRSLLASGVLDVKGVFDAKAVVKILSEDGRLVAFGKVRHDAEILRKIKLMRSGEAEKILGKKGTAIVAHCEDIATV